LRANAQAIIDQLIAVEEQMTRFNEKNVAVRPSAEGEKLGVPVLLESRETPGGTTEAPPVPVKTDPNSLLLESMRAPRAGEQRARGLLVRVDCSEKAITFTVKVGERLLKYRSTTLQSVELTTWVEEIGGDMTCGARKPANDVVVTYRPPGADARAKSDGEMIAIDFVPKSFVLK
jgi:hypothetical protein